MKTVETLVTVAIVLLTSLTLGLDLIPVGAVFCVGTSVLVLAGVKVVERGNVVDVGSAATAKALPFENTTLSVNAVPFHRILHELVLKLLGTLVHRRRSCFPRTVKPFGSVALPCRRMESRNEAAWALKANARAWNMT